MEEKKQILSIEQYVEQKIQEHKENILQSMGAIKVLTEMKNSIARTDEPKKEEEETGGHPEPNGNDKSPEARRAKGDSHAVETA